MPLDNLNDEDVQQRQEELLTYLRENGPKMSNSRLRQGLQWQEDLYWTIRDRLVDAGQLRLGKGQGGSVTLVPRTTPTAAEVAPVTPVTPPTEGQPPAAPTRLAEDQLYEPMATVLRTEWARDNRFREWIVEITARQGRRETGGKWTRPDLTVVSSTTLLYYPTKLFDVTTFEVKPSDAFDVTAVYEALAHRRAATRAYVLVHIPSEQQKLDPVQSVIEQMCVEAKRHGIGVIIASDPTSYEAWDEMVEAARHEPDPLLLNEFLTIQLSETAKGEIMTWFR